MPSFFGWKTRRQKREIEAENFDIELDDRIAGRLYQEQIAPTLAHLNKDEDHDRSQCYICTGKMSFIQALDQYVAIDDSGAPF